MKRIILIITSAYFGISLSAFANLHTNQWQLYAILIPVSIGFITYKYLN